MVIYVSNHIERKIEKILRKNENDFRRNRSTTSQILTIRRILEDVLARNREATILFIDFSEAFDSIHRGKMEQILLTFSLPVAAVISKVKLATILDGDPMSSFSIATTPRCWGGPYSFPWIDPLYSWSVPYNAEC